MLTFYFNIDGAPSEPMTFKGMAEARNEALRYLTQIAGEAPNIFWRHPLLAMTVTDEDGAILLTLRLAGTSLAERF